MKKRLYTRFVGIIVSDETYDQVKMITDKLEMSVSEFVRDLIEREIESVEGNEKVYQIADRNKAEEKPRMPKTRGNHLG
jgi:predicted DNA-binding protein